MVFLSCDGNFKFFSILGVQFFGNKFYKCYKDDDPLEKTEEAFLEHNITTKNDCIAKYGEEAWRNSKINFDNTVMAFFALYQVVCTLYIVFALLD